MFYRRGSLLGALLLTPYLRANWNEDILLVSRMAVNLSAIDH